MWAPAIPKRINPTPPIWSLIECRCGGDAIVEVRYTPALCWVCWLRGRRSRWAR